MQCVPAFRVHLSNDQAAESVRCGSDVMTRKVMKRPASMVLRLNFPHIRRGITHFHVEGNVIDLLEKIPLDDLFTVFRSYLLALGGNHVLLMAQIGLIDLLGR